MIDFANLYDETIDSLFAFGSRLTSDREMLKDCIHDVFVKLYSKRDNLDVVNNIESYLFISLRNRVHDEHRRSQHLCDGEISDESMRMLIEAEEYYHDRTEDQQELSASVASFFDKLSPRQRQIINLYYVEQMNYEDICRVMGIGYQSVRNLMHRSITRLRSYADQMRQAV